MPTLITEDPESYSEVEPSGRFILGDWYVDKSGRQFRWFKLVDAVIAKPGFVGEWASTTKNFVTVDRAGGSSLGRIPAGVAMTTTSLANPYSFWLVRGLTDKIINDTGASGAQVKMASSTTDGQATPSSAYTDNWVGTTRGVPSGAVLRQLVDVDL